MRIAHITDTHVVEPGGFVADRIDPTAALERTVARILELDPLPDVVLATGDLVNDGAPAQYDQLMSILAPLPMPVVACAGNHDDRTELRRCFPNLPSGGPDDPIDYVRDLITDSGAVRFVVLDTTEPGEHGGHLGDVQLAWLDGQLAASDAPVIVVQHHPPFLAGIAWMDDVALDNIDDEVAVLARHESVRSVVGGHYHRPITVGLGRAVGWCAPSSTVQIDVAAADPTYTSEPPAFALHDIGEHGQLHTHVITLTDAERWRPAWSLAADA